MSSQNITQLKAHFLTSKQFNDKQNPSASELWFTKLPHWLNYCGSGCLGIVTQPTVSGNEIDFYAGASFVVHCGKYSDGTNKNQIVYIDSEKYLTVNADGSYCFDENGNMVSGTIAYNAETNKVSVNGVEGSYTQKVQEYTYSGGIVTLGEDIKVMSIGGGATFTQSGDSWSIDFGSCAMQGGTAYFPYSESGSYVSVTFLTPMADTNYIVNLSGASYYTPSISDKSTTGMILHLLYSYDEVTTNYTIIGAK